LILIVAVFYLFFIRPQMKRSKDQKKFREALQKGQKVITIGGIHGRIVEIQDTTVTIEVEGQVRLKVEKSAIALDPSQTIGAK
jgi:preprotein translocase subunit YajC